MEFCTPVCIDTPLTSTSPLAVPRRGHVLATAAEKPGGAIRAAAGQLSAALQTQSIAGAWDAVYAPRTAEPGSPAGRSSAELGGWSLAASWVVGVAAGVLEKDATLRDAETWFLGGISDARLSEHLSVRTLQETQALLHCVVDATAFAELLPYILDPHGPGSRLSVRKEPGTQKARARKKAEGVFYTPQDVAAFMAREALCDLTTGAHPLTVFDPACGTGVFLLAALRQLERNADQADLLDLACSSLYGADVDPWALNATAFVLLHAVMQSVGRRSIAPLAAWHAIRLNLANVDTLRLDSPRLPPSDAGRNERLHLRSTLKGGTLPEKECRPFAAAGPICINEIFPDIGNGPRVIIGNPPYSDLGQRQDFPSLVRRFATLRAAPKPNADTYPLFVEQMIRLAAPDAHGGALVLPLSIACNSGSQFSTTRALISKTAGNWRFAFFDREPHALFGEDVKTRNALVLWSKRAAEHEVTLNTGPLQKWRGARRAQLFGAIRFTPIKADILAGIPKVSGSVQAEALERLLRQPRTLESAVVGIGKSTLGKSMASDGRTVHVSPTAYNFLSVFLNPSLPHEQHQAQLSENPLHTLDCTTPRHAFAVFAALNSYLAFWWWHVNGDGFHVSRRTLATFPIAAALLDESHAAALASLGEQLWSGMRAQPIFSLNRGRVSMGFTAAPFAALRLQTDKILTDATGLDVRMDAALARFSQSITDARPIHED